MAMKQEVNVPVIAAIGAVSVILLVVVVIGTSAWYLSADQDVTAENFEKYPDPVAKEVQDAQRDRINAAPHWVDAQHTVAAIPIDQAMQEVIATQGKVPMVAVPAPPPAPAGSK
jgi:hypothetical protein